MLTVSWKYLKGCARKKRRLHRQHRCHQLPLLRLLPLFPRRRRLEERQPLLMWCHILHLILMWFLKNSKVGPNCDEDHPRSMTIPTPITTTVITLRAFGQRLEWRLAVFIVFVFLCVGRIGKTSATLRRQQSVGRLEGSHLIIHNIYHRL